MAIEKVSLLNSNNTLLNSDSDYTKFELYLTSGSGGVLYSNLTTKPEFLLTGTTNPSVAKGSAIVVCNRVTSAPIANQKIAVRYETGSAKSFTGAVNGSKIYIEINQAMINDPSLITDVFPSTDFSLGLGIGTMNMSTSYPTTNPYIPLWTYNGTVWTDARTFPTINGLMVTLTGLTGDITTTGTVTGGRMKTAYSAIASDDVLNKSFWDANLAAIGAAIPNSSTTAYGTSRIATDAVAKAGTNQTDTINAKQAKDLYGDSVYLYGDTTLLGRSDTQSSFIGSGTTNVKKKEIQCNFSGSVMCKVDLYKDNTSSFESITARLFKNGSDTGFSVGNGTLANWINRLEFPEVTVASGDLLQIHITTTSSTGGYVRNFRIYADTIPSSNYTVTNM